LEKDIEKRYVRPMRLRWTDLFVSKVDTEVPWDRWDFAALGLAGFAVIFVFVFKLETFYALGYTSDLFVMVQAARSWLEGKGLFAENFSGNLLVTHPCLVLVPLGLIAKPFGAPGLLFVLAASVGAAYFWATRILRLLGVDGRVALFTAGVVLISPLTVAFYQEPGFGFHPDVLTPALCLILFYFLLQQRMIPSIVTALAVISVKEDAPIAAAMVAIVASGETWISSAAKQGHTRTNWPATITLLLSVSAIPLLLAISWSQPTTLYAHHAIDRLGMVKSGSLSSPGAVFVFVASNIVHWLSSSVVRQWLWVMIVGSFGTILLRPHYLIVCLPTTVVAWLKNANDLLWTPRFHPTETLLWCVTLVGCASIARAGRPWRDTWTRTPVLLVAIAIAAFSASAQFAVVPYAHWAYRLRPASVYSPHERQQADELFARYRREGNPQEPVVASTWLFRYAHDRNLFWLGRLRGRPVPIWILGDTEDKYSPIKIGADTVNRDSGIRMQDYTLIDRRGRFVLLKKKP
jgi:uncharacterized membrane protein